MKFKIREGFKRFKTLDEAILFETMGTRSGVRPTAIGGDTIHLTAAEVQQYSASGNLGKLIPIDDDAVKHFGNTAPMISRLISHPHEYAVPVPPTTTTTTEAYEPVYRKIGRAS